tara:strand:+ start:76768 stop:77370 length:603 start_codon:yes stop_codon:yes gene_type:complete
MSRIKKELSNKSSVVDFFHEYSSTIVNLFEKVPTQVLTDIGETFKEAHLNQRNIFIIGNGGSAATANHFATDLMLGPTRFGKSGFRAKSLCSNDSIMSAIGNDNGFENIFSKQIDTLANPKDILVLISASGNSANLIKAVKSAQEKKLQTVALIGFSGGLLNSLVDHSLFIESDDGDYGPIEDVHSVLQHCLANWLIGQI